VLHNGAHAKIFRNADELRKRLTQAEKVLWNQLRARRFLGLKFRRQHPFGEFIFDFYCHEQLLAIEVDGEIHSAPEQKARDTWRTTVLGEQGVRIIRIPNAEILTDVDKVMRHLEKFLTNDSSIGRG
jgi:very-short-patch-repair endonuclease